ncbi:imidazole glycerol phosphate synthase subunit HisF [Paremcibacter congregatus]|uniref:Imidazole glycerol phosphate synthase subunit HisF n=1 Tax=Paremcibacter congregatus TaxID=2043170 RepID=A0A2G4YRB0_9PROT|nr:imidazole glycerol phosphate synthase cyclase subunit [Paremcibacter congregatus]PHZ84810.1 imidazole glycerol phosphate synthase subunit HisF [Paremcibacter congregatus]QDE26216.1 imidazole glycerol phosphate synthase subunit HisF [Paremcibacter congregatus]
MSKKRVIARLDVKNEFVIKGIHLEGLRKVGDPNQLAKNYYGQGIDEIIFMDAVAAYYDRNNLSHIIEKACQDIFVPITVGGGIRSLEDIQTALNSGADKIAVNTKAVQTPDFIKMASQVFGAQCIVSSIDVKRISDQKWEVYVDNGREPTGLDAVAWAQQVEQLGAGEIMLTSIDQEGTKKGFDIELNQIISAAVNIPVISCGGAGTEAHVVGLFQETDVDAAALASVLHYDLLAVNSLKQALRQNEVKVRL